MSILIKCAPRTELIERRLGPAPESAQWLLQNRVSKTEVFGGFERNHLYHSDQQSLKIHLMRKNGSEVGLCL
ncbi:hypothetical protein Y032_0036g3293 [Ancylostoma ceylanicum]|uniref:Uncharacterized protein n=1 Tax=Ancylostoma ceylanicum TaxID=53326 RepID=A0A016UKF8_9BILA|nr:hypothetical protein Y032_0036g3293 [Ancylostoma ceylanicum]